MGNPSGEKPNNDFSDEVIAAKAEIAFKVRLDWIDISKRKVDIKFWSIDWLELIKKAKQNQYPVGQKFKHKIKMQETEKLGKQHHADRN